MVGSFDCIKFMTLDARQALNYYHEKGMNVERLSRDLKMPHKAAQLFSELDACQRKEIGHCEAFIAGTRQKKLRMRIPVRECRTLFGICDHSGVLQPGECYVRVSTKGHAPQTVTGLIMVTR
jgi:hypothetical protein